MGEITVSDRTKMNLVRHGPVVLFGPKNERPSRSAEAVELFDRVWESQLRALVESALSCSSDSALRRIHENNQPFFVADQLHRELTVKRLQMIAQLREVDQDSLELTQLWALYSSDAPQALGLYVRFDDAEELEQVSEVARSLGHNPEDLARELLRDFVRHAAHARHR